MIFFQKETTSKSRKYVIRFIAHSSVNIGIFTVPNLLQRSHIFDKYTYSKIDFCKKC